MIPIVEELFCLGNPFSDKFFINGTMYMLGMEIIILI